MDVGAAVVADEQSFELVQPGEGAFDDPAVASEAGAVLGLAAGNLRGDATTAELATVAVRVVAAISGHPVRAAARATDLAAHRRHAVDQRDQLSDVVAVAAGECPGERDPGRVDKEVMLRPVSGSVNRARARLGAPFFACT